MKLRKIATGVATIGLLFATMAPAVFADVTIDGNGADSTNGVIVVDSSKCKVSQSSNTAALTFVYSSADTSGNTANSNTGGGDVTVKSGDASSTVKTEVTGGDNTATDPCCGCTPATPPADVTISNNGKDSTNGVITVTENNKKVKQTSNTFALTGVLSSADSGNNKANGNTGGGNVKVKSGKSTSTVTTKITGGSNSL